MNEEVPTLEECFPFEYRGGGYFRMRDVPVGKSAEILHGMQAIEYLYEALKRQSEKTEETS